MALREVFAGACLVVICLVLLLLQLGTFDVPSASFPQRPKPLPLDLGLGGRGFHLLPRECGGVLTSVSRGRWVQGKMTKEQRKVMDRFVRVSAEQHRVPYSLEREDGRCGNITYPKSPQLRALCNPTGRRPCCRQHRCQALPVDKCSCPKCYDLRNQIYAEHSRWVTSEPQCQFWNFSAREACQVSRDTAMFFIGDSLMRHLYMGAQILLTGNPHDGTFKEGVSKELRGNCSGLYMFTEKICRNFIAPQCRLCNGTVFVRLLYWSYVRYAARLAGHVRGLLHHPNTFIFVSIGLHERNDLEKIFTNFTKPALDVLKTSGAVWPKLVWIGIHAHGPLKSPWADKLNQHNEGIRRFNEGLRQRFRPYGVPVLDAFNFSLGVSSFDGTHQALGVNLLKMQALLNYVAEVRSRH